MYKLVFDLSLCWKEEGLEFSSEKNTKEKSRMVCKVCAQCVCTVSDDNLFPTTISRKEKAHHKD